MALQATIVWFLTLQPCLAQNELWVLNETPPSLGRIDLTSFNYEELLCERRHVDVIFIMIIRRRWVRRERLGRDRLL